MANNNNCSCYSIDCLSCSCCQPDSPVPADSPVINGGKTKGNRQSYVSKYRGHGLKLTVKPKVLPVQHKPIEQADITDKSSSKSDSKDMDRLFKDLEEKIKVWLTTTQLNKNTQEKDTVCKCKVCTEKEVSVVKYICENTVQTDARSTRDIPCSFPSKIIHDKKVMTTCPYPSDIIQVKKTTTRAVDVVKEVVKDIMTGEQTPKECRDCQCISNNSMINIEVVPDWIKPKMNENSTSKSCLNLNYFYVKQYF